MNQADIRSAIQGAFASWAGATNLVFSEVTSGEDITLGWFVGAHGDGTAFDDGGGYDSDGKWSNVLAHGFFPAYGGDVHFDDYENWSFSSSSGIHLESIAVHELGHALGLAHSSLSTAVMYSTYSGGARTSLTSDDRAGIWSLYPRTRRSRAATCWPARASRRGPTSGRVTAASGSPSRRMATWSSTRAARCSGPRARTGRARTGS